MSWVREAKIVRCTEHGTEWAHGAVMPCQRCVPDADAPLIDPMPGDDDVESATAEGLPDTRDHERWCVTLSNEALTNSRTLKTSTNLFGDQPSACGPAWARVALSARIDAADRAERRERREWVREIHRLRAIAATGGDARPSLPSSTRGEVH